MKLVKKYPILGSSQNPEELSLTIKSALLSLVPLIILIAKSSGIEIIEIDLIQFINVIFSILSSVGIVYGLIRKYK